MNHFEKVLYTVGSAVLLGAFRAVDRFRKPAVVSPRREPAPSSGVVNDVVEAYLRVEQKYAMSNDGQVRLVSVRDIVSELPGRTFECVGGESFMKQSYIDAVKAAMDAGCIGVMGYGEGDLSSQLVAPGYAFDRFRSLSQAG
ncbi:MAG: hypothetical protein EOP06_31360 [Proteobacteria bacterium]|nr:MAG: hypothetical protein EOP06_31360 [Pseudomonadota bacterium]